MITPEITGSLRNHFIEVPKCISQATGIRIFGKMIRSLVFSTDVAVIRNINADAVIAVYPFTPQPMITHAIILAAEMPVFCGVGGGYTTGKRVVSVAQDAEFQGAIGVVVNAPTEDTTIRMLKTKIDIPIVVTVVSEYTDFAERIKSGAGILNVSGAQNTPNIVKAIRSKYPDIPIIATGGQKEESIIRTLEAGANAISYTPPLASDMVRRIMEGYRKECSTAHAPVLSELKDEP